MTTAMLADGTQLEFPDGTSPDVISKVVKQHIAGTAQHQATPQEKSFFDESLLAKITNPQNIKDMAGGLVRGAGSIGASILLPADMINQKLRGDNFFSMKDNNERRQAIDDGLQTMGADTTGGLYKTGKIAAEIAGTGDIGGVLGVGAKAAGAVKLGNALKSGGFSLGVNGGNKVVNAATRVAGGAGVGGASAALVNPDDAGMGAVIGGAVPGAAKLLHGAAKVIGSAGAPLYEGGKNRIIADLLMSKTGDNTGSVINRLEQAKGNTAGFNPTVGQSADNADLATMERVFKERNPNMFQGVNDGQTSALVNAVRGLGGSDVSRQSLVDARSNAVDNLYKQAKQTTLPVDDTLNELLQRPAVAQAQKEATTNALNRGATTSPITPSDGTALTTDLGNNNQYVNGDALHELKMALDAAKNHVGVGGANKAQLSAIGDASGDFNNYLDNAIPAYAQAKNTFSTMSKPINQMDLGNAIADKYVPAIYRDIPIPNQLNHDQLAKALYDNGDKMAQSVTGFKGATLENTLHPDQLQALQNVVKDTNYIKDGQLQGKPVNSSTFQNLAFNSNLEDGILPKLIKNLAPVSLIGGMLKGGRDLLYSGTNDALQQKLADMLLSPENTANLMKARQSQLGNQQALAALLAKPGYAQVGGVATAQ